MDPDTAGCKSVKNFAAPGRRISSRSYSRQYDSGVVDWTAGLDIEDYGFAIRGPVVGDRYVFVTAQVNENHEAEEGADEGVWVRVIAVDPAEAEVAWTKTLQGRYGHTFQPAVANETFNRSVDQYRPAGRPEQFSEKSATRDYQLE
jgi:hypothetical protein